LDVAYSLILYVRRGLSTNPLCWTWLIHKSFMLDVAYSLILYVRRGLSTNPLCWT